MHGLPKILENIWIYGICILDFENMKSTRKSTRESSSREAPKKHENEIWNIAEIFGSREAAYLKDKLDDIYFESGIELTILFFNMF